MPPRRKSTLQVVTAETEQPVRPRTVLEASESGTYLDELINMRRVVSRAIDDPATAPRDLGTLTRRQLEISKEIHALQAAANGDDIGAAAATPDEVWATS